MTLIKSISGIRGTIGGKPSDALTPIDIVKFTASYVTLMKETVGDKRKQIVVGRDARISGSMVDSIVCGTLNAMGVDVFNVGLSTTPTVEVAVTELKADGGIILTASHNPKQWNALKLLNNEGEFLNAAEGEQILKIAEKEAFSFADVDDIGSTTIVKDMIEKHIDKVLELSLVDVQAITNANFSVAIDAVDSTGGIAIPKLLKKLGVKNIIEINCEPTGDFSHNPEPIPENLTEISDKLKGGIADVGFVVDPDVDRLAVICEDGTMFNEEYTLVAVADYVLQHTKGNTVSNMSSSRALRDVTEKYGGEYAASAVGEVNVVTMMKENKAVIGGEGNGGIIYPEAHYGRDSLVGVALFLTHLAKSGMKVSELKKTYPEYVISKNKIALTPSIDVDDILRKMEEKYSDYPVNTIDGVKIEFDKEWVHLRKSNTEPIIRIYSESKTKEDADKLANRIIVDIKNIAGL